MVINLISIKRASESRCLINLSLVIENIIIKIQYVYIEYMDDTDTVRQHANFSKFKFTKKQREEISNFCYSCMKGFLEMEASYE